MKKKILNYLPIAIALILVGACALALNIYESHFAEYAVFSYSNNEYSFDMKVSPSGKIVSLDPINKLSYENEDRVSSVVGMNIEDAAKLLAETLGDDTAFLAVVAAEQKEPDISELKALAERASSVLKISHLTGYGTYSELIQNRVNTFELSLGRIACISAFADFCAENIDGCYLDTYSLSPADPESVAYYINYVRTEVLSEELAEKIAIDVSNVKFDTEYITLEDAFDSIQRGSEVWYGEPVNDFKYTGISIDSGSLRYKFETQFYGYTSYVYVNMIDGMVFFDDEGY